MNLYIRKILYGMKIITKFFTKPAKKKKKWKNKNKEIIINNRKKVANKIKHTLAR